MNIKSSSSRSRSVWNSDLGNISWFNFALLLILASPLQSLFYIQALAPVKCWAQMMEMDKIYMNHLKENIEYTEQEEELVRDINVNKIYRDINAPRIRFSNQFKLNIKTFLLKCQRHITEETSRCLSQSS